MRSERKKRTPKGNKTKEVKNKARESDTGTGEGQIERERERTNKCYQRLQMAS